RLGISHCHPHTTLQKACSKITDEDISSLVVVDGEGFLEGIITRTDVLRAALADREGWAERLVADCMTRNVVTVTPEIDLQQAAERLVEHGIHRVVVVQQEGDRLRPLAVVSDSDIVYHLCRRD
ncbi:MAG: CBS domain-containing protein, partial [Caldilineales bacterium]|nr:CBS domain-containing protein [Caldilineales bacterium]